MPKPITLYTKSSCPFCIRAKHLLESKGVNFEEIVLDDQPEELENLRERTGMHTVPQIFIGEELIGVFTELAQLEQKGELDDKLN